MTATADPDAPSALDTGESVKDILTGLSHVALLQALPPEDIEPLLEHVDKVSVAKGEPVFSKGDPGDALYVIDQGSVRLVGDDGAAGSVAGPTDVLGEEALLHGDPRPSTAVAETDTSLWRISRADFDAVLAASADLRAAHAAAAQQPPGRISDDASRKRAWVGIALRAREARHRGLKTWHVIGLVGLAMWVLLKVNASAGWIESELGLAGLQLVCGLLLIDAASEALILATDRTGARFNWDGFTSGTIGSLVETFPEFVVVAFLVFVDPMAAFVTSAVTLFNNGLAFSVYSFFLPKDQKGRFVMPESLAKAGNEVLIAGSGISLIVGLVMIGGRAEGTKSAFGAVDLVVLAVIFMSIYAYYQWASIKYYAEGYGADSPNHPPDPNRLGHDTTWRAIGFAALIGIGASYTGGEAIGAFADTAINHLHWPTIPTAAALAFFAGISEFVVVIQAHRRGEIGIALSNTFGGITQVQTLLLAFTMLVIGILAFATGSPTYSVPFNVQTTLLMVLQFPMLYVLVNFIEEDHTLNNLDAAAMTGVYLLLLYFLFSI